MDKITSAATTGQQPDLFEASVVTAVIFIVGADRLLRDMLGLFFESEHFSVIVAQNINQIGHLLEPTLLPMFMIHCFGRDEMSALDVSSIRKLKRCLPALRVLVLTEYINKELIRSIVTSGIDGLIPRSIPLDLLKGALDILGSGQRILPLHLSGFADQPQHPTAAIVSQALGDSSVPIQPRQVELSRREMQIMDCLVDGLSNKAIARKLVVTEATVKVHIKGLLRKLQVSNRTQAAIQALSYRRSSAASFSTSRRDLRV